MQDYTIIADISNAFLQLLKKNLVPEVIQNGEAIVLGSSGEKGDASLSLFLYDIRELRDNELFGRTGKIAEGIHRRRYPSMYLELSYVITAFSAGDIKYRGMDEQRILGKVLQSVRDYSMEAVVDGQREQNPGIELIRPEQEEKLKILGMPGMLYRPSLFYRVAPVELKSTQQEDIQRVQVIDFTYMDKGANFKAGGAWKK